MSQPTDLIKVELFRQLHDIRTRIGAEVKLCYGVALKQRFFLDCEDISKAILNGCLNIATTKLSMLEFFFVSVDQDKDQVK